MTSFNRVAWKAAVTIHEKLEQKQLLIITLPEREWKDTKCLVQQIEKADQKNWTSAGTTLRQRSLRLLCCLRERVSEIENELKSLLQPCAHISLREIYGDLCGLDDEFSDVEYSLSGKSISVITENIVLEGIELGRFQIILDWNQINEQQPYQIESLDPNPAASSSDTTHPHVQGTQLCEGEGQVAIRSARQQGRLLDFFVMVRQILETYNDGSPYVKLCNWYGINCQDCGNMMDEDEQYRCQQCYTDVCNMCSYCCNQCYDNNCCECSRMCSDCGSTFCQSCVNQCETCNEIFCKECLTDEKCET